MSLPFLKKETFGLRTQETFIGKRCEIYLPKNYFNKNDEDAIAVEIGDKVRTTGLFWFNIDGQLYELQLPLKFEFKFSSIEKRKFKIKPNLPEEDYMVYILEYGDPFVYDILHKKDLDDFVKGFIKKLIENAKLPQTTSYSDTVNIFLSAMQATGVTELGISSTSIEMMLSEMFRDRKNLKKPYRLTYNGNEYGYRMIRITKIPEQNSTFTSLIGEDIQNQLVASILRQREGSVERPSPVEQVIKY